MNNIPFLQARAPACCANNRQHRATSLIARHIPALLVGLAALIDINPSNAQTPAAPLIALDVGHSLAHPGAQSARGKDEFTFNAALAQQIAQYFTQQEIAYSLIGAAGDITELRQRTAQAAEQGASFFVSLHHDSAQAHLLKKWRWQGVERHYADQFSGYSLFVSRKNPQWQQSLHCASKIGFALQKLGLRATPHHAENIPGENRAWADQAAGVYFFDDLLVLKTASMPALLLEAGVIVNRAEELAVQRTERKILIAKALAQGFRACGVLADEKP